MILTPFTSLGQHLFSGDSIAWAPSPDTLNVTEFYFSEFADEEEGRVMLNSVEGIHDFLPSYQESIVRNDLGNIGSAEQFRIFTGGRSFGFNLRSSRKSYWKGIYEKKILISRKMYSNVRYVNGANRENLLDADFTRGFGRLLNIGFNFTRLNSEGAYTWQKNLVTDITLYATFHTPKERYMANIMFGYTGLKVEENGGISSDSVFEKNITSGRGFIPVSLESASNRWKGFEVGIEHRFFLTKEDSTTVIHRYRPAVSHSFIAKRNSMVYSDIPDTTFNFYQNIYLDSLSTYDSTNLLGVTNTVRFELVRADSMSNPIVEKLTVGGLHEYYRVAYNGTSTPINNIGAVATANGMFAENVKWEVVGKLMVFGPNRWDADVSFGADHPIKRSVFNGSVEYSSYQPDFIGKSYVSNHFIWNHNWAKTQHFEAGLRYEQRRLRFAMSVNYHLLDNVVVYGVDKLPFQSGAVNQLIVTRLQEHFKLHWFHVVLDGALQTILSGNDIRVPLAMGRGTVYYQNDIFKRRLRLQLGAEVSYSTKYYANAYNPALSAFYLQNDVLIGNYPFIDVFLNLRVKRFKAFVKVEHINAGWMGYRYYLAPHYPANDLAWKFGISWAFFD